ncbi:hypothetical protein Q9295_10090 [Xinfangfangia sp. CPCC 101601]|uniref:Phosphoribosyl-ATP diphosphatase n=1 Tax=Pseudogemmobacter lacusdianii TaxID=3069608 RepID=A0ABU0VYA0_9RHOB|nr:hypothetical protein [Xinfangfangia sp. CPCC 101601]MDQ2066727.1 hypothetical protein [Xinfangfangia sp. CPCC 101601]
MIMNNPFAQRFIPQVVAFMEAAGQTPNMGLQAQLMLEESQEALEALDAYHANPSVELAAALLKEIGDALYVSVGVAIAANYYRDNNLVFERIEASPEGVMALDGFGNILHETAAMIGDEGVAEILQRVVDSNMTKVAGGVVRDPETGKVLKGPNYVAPDLTDLAVTVHEKVSKMNEELEGLMTILAALGIAPEQPASTELAA